MSYNVVIVDEDFELVNEFISLPDAVAYANKKGFKFNKPSVNKSFILSDMNDLSVCTIGIGDIKRQKNLSIIFFDEEVYLQNKAKQKFLYIIVNGRHLFFNEKNIIHTIFSRIERKMLKSTDGLDVKEMSPVDAINAMYKDIGIDKDWRKYAKRSN